MGAFDMAPEMATRLILAVNAGSATIKFGAFALPTLERVGSGHIDAVGQPGCVMRVTAGADSSETSETRLSGADYVQATAALVDWVHKAFPNAAVSACSHRIVHGGADLKAPVLLDEAIFALLDGLTPLAPLHQPHNLAAARAFAAAFPDARQVACFDTAFHRGHPKVAEVYALPMALTDDGIRRYGFHGLSYEYIAQRLKALDPALAAGRTVVAHLGSGASLCALSNGQSIASTMGFTALDGLPMATRIGQIDPGAVLHMLREGRTVDEVERIFYRESGLLGLSGVSGDMRALQASTTPEAAFAIRYYTHHIAREIGALAIDLGGLDGIVFTAGVGENQPAIRAEIVYALGSLGAHIDAAANAEGAERFDAPGSAVKLLRVATDEEMMLARHAMAWA